MGSKLYLRVSENGEMVMEGTAVEIAGKFGVTSPSTVTNAAKHKRKMFWKYDVEVIEKEEIIKKQPTEHEKRLDYLYRRLFYPPWEVYSKKEPLDFVDELKEMGIRIRWYECSDGEGYHLERIK